jgi:hypothetical protein
MLPCLICERFNVLSTLAVIRVGVLCSILYGLLQNAVSS